MNVIYIILGILCFLYYLIIGLYARFGLSISMIWPSLGAMLIAVGAVYGRLPKGVLYLWRAAVCVGLIAIAVLEGCVISGMLSHAPAGCEAVIILGARVENDGTPSRALRHRIESAEAYLKANPETVAICSGGKGSDEVISEAECIRRELIARGISEERIFMEERSTDTAENMAYSREFLSSPEAEVAVITNNYHVFRATQLAKKAGMVHAHGIAASYVGPTLPHFMVREALAIVLDFLSGNL